MCERGPLVGVGGVGIFCFAVGAALASFVIGGDLHFSTACAAVCYTSSEVWRLYLRTTGTPQQKPAVHPCPVHSQVFLLALHGARLPYSLPIQTMMTLSNPPDANAPTAPSLGADVEMLNNQLTVSSNNHPPLTVVTAAERRYRCSLCHSR